MNKHKLGIIGGSGLYNIDGAIAKLFSRSVRNRS